MPLWEYFEKNSVASLALLATLLCVWVYVFLLWRKAFRLKSLLTKMVAVEYVVPKDVSLIMAMYLLSFGQISKNILESSVIEVVTRLQQNLIMTDLFHKGLLESLTFEISDSGVLLEQNQITNKIRYKISSSYQEKAKFLEEKIFLDKLVQYSGMEGELVAPVVQQMNNKYGNYPLIVGYKQTDKFWVKYFTQDLKNIAVAKGYVNSMLKSYFYDTLFVSVAFGSFIFWLISVFNVPVYLYYFLSFLIIPQFILYLLFAQLFSQLNINLPSDTFWVSYLFWFLFSCAWTVILMKDYRILNFHPTKEGIEIIQNLMEYREYLKTVESKKIEFALENDNIIKADKKIALWLIFLKNISLNKLKSWNQLV